MRSLRRATIGCVLLLAFGVIQPGEAQGPDEVVPAQFTVSDEIDLLCLRNAFSDDKFQEEVENALQNGPCRFVGLRRAVSGGAHRGYFGTLAFGQIGGPALSRTLEFLYLHRSDPSGSPPRVPPDLFFHHARTGDSVPNRLVFSDVLSYRFLLHVLALMPGEIREPLHDYDLIRFFIEHEGGSSEQLSLYLVYAGSLGRRTVVVSAEWDGAGFGSLSFN